MHHYATICILAVLFFAARTADPKESGAEAAYQNTLHTLTAIEKEIPALTKSADAAAALITDHEDIGITAGGSSGFVAESMGRAGGLRDLGNPHKNMILLYALRENNLEDDAKQITAQKPLHLILFAPQNLLDAAKSAGLHADAVIPTQAEPLVVNHIQVPTQQTAALTTLWAWHAEFIAACTRRSKVPAVWQSIGVLGAKEYNDKRQKLKFEDPPSPSSNPRPIPASQLAKSYLAAIHDLLTKLHDRELTNIQSFARAAALARSKKLPIYILCEGHATPALLQQLQDPQLFTPLELLWRDHGMTGFKFPQNAALLALGYDRVFRQQPYLDLPQAAREAHLTVAWAFAPFRPEEKSAVLPNETLIDTQWSLGDAAIAAPNYDIPILPPSGILTAALYQMLTAEILAAPTPQK